MEMKKINLRPESIFHSGIRQRLGPRSSFLDFVLLRISGIIFLPKTKLKKLLFNSSNTKEVSKE